MSIKDRIQDAMKDAMRAKDQPRLECLRMAKGALLMKEKSGAGALTDEISVAALRAEVKKRQQSIEIFRQVGREAEVVATEREIQVLEEFLPQQMDAAAIEQRVRAYYAEHPELNNAGKLTGAMKKELGELADGRVLNEICKKVVEG